MRELTVGGRARFLGAGETPLPVLGEPRLGPGPASQRSLTMWTALSHAALAHVPGPPGRGNGVRLPARAPCPKVAGGGGAEHERPQAAPPGPPRSSFRPLSVRGDWAAGAVRSPLGGLRELTADSLYLPLALQVPVFPPLLVCTVGPSVSPARPMPLVWGCSCCWPSGCPARFCPEGRVAALGLG